ncbi:MAG TPA: hypothetical protein VMH80_01010 [Bryobacteraceae bacterium]|nr:hypothetical protein [Bryobacteraceae bacterium]
MVSSMGLPEGTGSSVVKSTPPLLTFTVAPQPPREAWPRLNSLYSISN